MNQINGCRRAGKGAKAPCPPSIACFQMMGRAEPVIWRAFMRREIAKAYFRRMGGAKRYPSPHAPAVMGIASLHPSYGTDRNSVEMDRRPYSGAPCAIAFRSIA